MSHPTARLTARLGGALLLAGALSGCRSAAGPEAGAPAATEALALAVRTRAPAPGERLPAVRAGGAPAGLTVRVTRAALCDTQAAAAVARAPGEVAVVARVGGNPAANCTPDAAVVEYGGTVAGLAPGRYRVRVYEAVADGAPRLLGTARATVGPPAP